MSQLLTHCGSQRCSLEQLLSIPEPEKTQTYQPLNHYDFAVNTLTVASDLIRGFQFAGDQYALSSDGQKMFGVMNYQKESSGENDLKLSIGIRNSYDKSMAAGLCIGASVIVCDNMMFQGEITVLRKHTGENMHQELQDDIVTAIYKSQHSFSKLSEDARRMKQIPMIKREKFEFLGNLTGQKILTPTQSSKVFREVWKPSHEEFRSDSLWAAYNCATESLKSSAPQDIIRRHSQLHALTRKLYLN